MIEILLIPILFFLFAFLVFIYLLYIRILSKLIEIEENTKLSANCLVQIEKTINGEEVKNIEVELDKAIHNLRKNMQAPPPPDFYKEKK